DGSFRQDRSRLRYRFRVGTTYKNDWYSVGLRIRTGDPNKQQDPQLTLGKGFKEFGTLPIGFEKIFFQANWKNTKIWAGKNTYPFEKNNELFWSDNVFPEGITLEKAINVNTKLINEIKLIGGHFILGSNDSSFSNDAYLSGLQTSVSGLNKRVHIFPSLYLFRNIPNIPDGSHTFLIDYTILHFGTKALLLKDKSISFELDFYRNVENYDQSNDVPQNLKNQKTGYTIGLQYGALKTKKDWFFIATYANLQRYSVVDFMAQNDWARWDYSGDSSPDGRLSNLNGVEIVAAYAINNKMNVVMKYYTVNQLVTYGIDKETGQRIRFDLNVKI
ncbi:putative porin, partial [Saprospiraceae bacterium]|nr:putative porin [Saprospiraceae bacterium]